MNNNNCCSSHGYNCPYYNNINNSQLALKGGSVITNPTTQQRQQQSLIFPLNELAVVSKTLELSRFYVQKNPKQFQDSNTLLQKINQATSIISSKSKSKSNNNMKGASISNNNTNICSNTKKQSLKNLLNCFSLF